MLSSLGIGRFTAVLEAPFMPFSLASTSWFSDIVNQPVSQSVSEPVSQSAGP